MRNSCFTALLAFTSLAVFVHAETPNSPEPNKPIIPIKHEVFACTVKSAYAWEEGKILSLEDGRYSKSMSIFMERNGQARLSGGSEDDGKWNEQYRVIKPDELRLQFVQSGANPESTVLRLVRNSKGQFDFIYYGGPVAIFESGECVQVPASK